jgi:hypothetical protein
VETPPHVEAKNVVLPSVDASVDAGAPAENIALDSTPDAGVTAPCTSLVWAESACLIQRDQTDPLDADVLAKWYADRGARAPSETPPPMCREDHVGPSSEAALVCDRMSQPFEKTGGTDVFRVVLDRVIVVVRKGRAVTIFDRPYYIEVLDKEVLERGPLFALDVELGSGGNEVDVRELAPDACATATKSLADEQKTASNDADKEARTTMLAWTRFDQKLLGRVCAGVGRYVWKDSAFARVR